VNQPVKKDYLNNPSIDISELDNVPGYPPNNGNAGNSVVFSAGKRRNDWQLFTSHGLVLISILYNPGRTVREIGLELNITDRAVALALADLVKDGYLVREKIGRRTFYHVDEDHPLRYPVSGFGLQEKPNLTVRALRAENLATHAKDNTGQSA
jgi:hypothetical protein